MDGIRILVKVRQKKRASKRSAYYPVGLIACKRQYLLGRERSRQPYTRQLRSQILVFTMRTRTTPCMLIAARLAGGHDQVVHDGPERSRSFANAFDV